ncbi:unnamed protein product [Schistosoma haematobium]|nr:unnamed protein product [Schistosoma haematobium]CAH8573328.1 unnamed protein product [Schistosoma haematobium]
MSVSNCRHIVFFGLPIFRHRVANTIHQVSSSISGLSYPFQFFPLSAGPFHFVVYVKPSTLSERLLTFNKFHVFNDYFIFYFAVCY